ncbi:MAG: HNH endonuclease signature motif containing protein [Cyanobacteria bacterium]|nr:HNH endonuclease signature motif containing protein [Cyanobacteriota bacterium]
MPSEVSASLRRSVIERSQAKCEYCKLHQDFSIYTHEIDHVIAMKHGGRAVLENLALSCLSCNRHKGSDLTSFDPLTGDLTRLFDPRSQVWAEHFELDRGRIQGLSAIGRTTVMLLKFNTPTAVLNRQLWQQVQSDLD